MGRTIFLNFPSSRDFSILLSLLTVLFSAGDVVSVTQGIVEPLPEAFDWILLY